MNVIGLFLQVGILWFLITLFTRETHANQSLIETWIIIFGVLIVGFISRLLFRSYLGPFTIIFDVAALYLLVDKVCGTNRKTTVRICAWYFGVSFLIGLLFTMVSVS